MRLAKNGIRALYQLATTREEAPASLFAFATHNLLAPIVTVGADVMAQMHFTRGGLQRHRRSRQRVVRTMHAALGRRFFVLLNSHENYSFVTLRFVIR